LTQHLRDEDPEPREMHLCLEVEPLRTWYYCISPNFRTSVILLQVDPTSNDKLETVYESFTKPKTPPSLHGLQFPMLNIIVV